MPAKKQAVAGRKAVNGSAQPPKRKTTPKPAAKATKQALTNGMLLLFLASGQTRLYKAPLMPSRRQQTRCQGEGEQGICGRGSDADA